MKLIPLMFAMLLAACAVAPITAPAMAQDVCATTVSSLIEDAKAQGVEVVVESYIAQRFEPLMTSIEKELGPAPWSREELNEIYVASVVGQETVFIAFSHNGCYVGNIQVETKWLDAVLARAFPRA